MERRLHEELHQSRPFASLEQEVFLQIQCAAQAAMRWVAEALKPSGLTPSQFNVLRIVRGSRPAALCHREIADRLVTHDPDLTRLLDRLEGRGLLEKSRSERDRRVVSVRITAEGLRVVECATRAVSLRLREELGALSERRLDHLADLLELVRQGKG